MIGMNVGEIMQEKIIKLERQLARTKNKIKKVYLKYKIKKLEELWKKGQKD